MSGTHQPSIDAPDRKMLRQFGFVLGGGLIVLFGLLFPWIADRPIPLWPYVTAAVFSVAGVVFPPALSPVYKIWMKIGHVLGWINTRIILGLVFFALVIPIGMLLRLFGKDPMARRLDSGESTYRVPSTGRPPDDLERPF